MRFQALLDKADWSALSSGLNLQEKISLLTSLLEEAVAEIFPLKEGKSAGNKIPPLMRKLM